MPLRQIQHVALARALSEEAATRSRSLSRPVVIAFGGQGNCRKTALGRAISRVLHDDGLTSTVIEIDDYAYPRPARLASGISGYDPRSFNVSAFHAALKALTHGEEVTKPFYDHRFGTVCDGCLQDDHRHNLTPSSILIAIGVYPDLLNLQAQLVPDLSVFFIRAGIWSFVSRLRRDVRERGYSFTQSITNYRQMRRDFGRYMLPALDWYTHHCEVRSRAYTLQRRTG